MKRNKETTKDLSRRDFIKTTAVGIGATALAGLTAKEAEAQARPMNWDQEADVVVVGYGGGGAIAAMEAYDAGAKALILEKLAADTPTAIHHFCSTRQSNSGQTCWNGTLADGVKYYKYATAQLIPDDVAISLVQKWMDYKTWLLNHGANPAIFGAQSTPPTGGGPIQSVTLANAATPALPWGGAVYWDLVTKNIASRKDGIQVFYETPAQHLIFNPETKEVIGVEATSGNWSVHVKARRAVVVACGGMEQDFQRKFNTYLGLNFEFTDCPGNTGDGFAMLEDLGADLWNTGWSSGRLNLNQAHFPGLGVGVYITMPSSSSAPGGAIKVDQYGSRFLNETTIGTSMLTAVSYWDTTYRLFPRNPAWFIFDEGWRVGTTPLGGSIPQSTLGIYKFSTGGVDEIAKGWILKGATFDELAAKINAAPYDSTLVSPNNTGLMSAGTLKATVDAWNGYCAAGSDPLGRAKASLTAFASTGPFYAVAIFPGAEETYGGPRKNGKGQVLRSDGSVIKRVYEAGELGITSTVPGSPISAMTETAFSGRIAGENAAAETPWS